MLRETLPVQACLSFKISAVIFRYDEHESSHLSYYFSELSSVVSFFFMKKILERGGIDVPNRNKRSIFRSFVSRLSAHSSLAIRAQHRRPQRLRQALALPVPCRSHNARLKLHKNDEEAVLFLLSTGNTSRVILYLGREFRIPNPILMGIA